MKPKRQNPFFLAAVSLASLALTVTSSHAANYYWDNNGATALFGTAGGTWAAPTTNSGTQGWSTDAAGATLPSGTTTVLTSDSENFGTATASSLLAGTITVSGTVTPGNITFGSGAGAITLSGGTINMGASSITVNNGSDTISSVLGGSNALTKAGTGTLILSGVNTRTGALTISAGTIGLGNASALGAASGVTVSSGAALISTAVSPTLATMTLSLAGTGTAGGGALQTSGGSGTTTWNGAVSLAAAALVHSDGGTAINIGGTINLSTFILTVQTDGSNTNTFSGIISGTGGITKTSGSTLVLSAVNTYTGATTVSAGTLTLSGARTATATGGFTVGNLASSTGTLNISNGTFNLGTSTVVGSGANTIAGIVNQTGGSVTTAANQLLLGNGGIGTTAGSNSTGTYNLSAGTLNTIAGLGVLIGVNTGTTGVFNLSGTGTLNMAATSTLEIGRSDNSPATNTTGTFSQTAGTATVGVLQMGGSNTTPANNAGANATLNLSGGTFTATTFNQLSGANTSTSTINISGTAVVTLPAFPTARGTSSTATITFNGGTLKNSTANSTYMGGLTNAFIKAGGARFDTANGSITITQSLLTDPVSLGGGLTKQGANTLTLAGAGTFTGATIVNAGTLVLSGSPTGNSAVTVNNGGILQLDYSTNNTSKINDAALLTLSGGTVDLSGGSHTEIVASTTLTANTTSNITRSSPGSVLQMGAITPGSGASINFGASNIATTSTPNTNGILGSWATVGGTDWATNSGSPGTGLITAVTYDVDVPRLTPGIIANGPANNIRLVEGSGFAGGITLGSPTTTINTLTQSTFGGSSAATIDPSGQSLLTNAILVSSGAGALSIGNGFNNGNLSAATAGGNLLIINNAAGSLTVNSVIADNTSASSLTQLGTGSVTLVGANTYTGATTISAGTLRIGNGGTTGSIASTSGVTNNAALVYNRGDALSVPYVISGTGTVTQAGAGTLTLTKTNTYTGTTTISVGTTLQLGNGTSGNDGTIANSLSVVNNGALLYNRFGAISYGGVISGTGTVTVSGSGSQTLTATNTYSGGTTISTGGTLAATVAGAMSTGNVTNNGTLNLTGGALTYTGLSNAVPGALGGNGIVNVTLGTGTGTTILNGDYSTFTGTWNVGIGAAAGAGKVQMNGVDNAGATINLLTNATLYSNGAGVVHNAAIVLNGGDTGESIGQLRLESGAVWAGPVTLAGNITGAGDGFFGGNNAGGIGTISGNIGETGGPRALSKVGAGTIILTGTNSYTGATTIGAGVLVAQGSVGLALPTTSAVSLGAGTIQILNNAAGTIAQSNTITLSGSVTAGIAVGNAGGVTTGSTVAFGALNNGTTANAFGSTINFTGANGYLQSFASLALSGATGNGTTLNPTTTSVTIAGNVTNQMFGYTTGNFATLTLGGTSTGNAINGIISDAATGTPGVNSGDTRISKSGTSTWTLNGPNTYIGTTAITGGVLRITNALSLGNTTSGTTQSGSSALEIDGTGGAVLVGAETLSISGGGTGTTNFGALRNIAGNNTYGGTVTLAAQSRINSDSGTLLLNNATAVAGAGQNLVIGGAGNITISGAITTTTGFVARDGNGTLTLSGANTYTGATTASAGIISLTGSIASSNVSISGTGVFSESGTGSIAGTGTFIQGSLGTSTLAGTNTYTGATTISAGTLVLDYSTQDNSKLSDIAALTLSGGTLDLKGGTHTETVLSTTLTANTASRVTSTTPGSVLQMNTITPGAGATIDFATDNIATTDTLNNASGVLGNWATVNGGTDLAMNSGSTTAGGATIPGTGVADGFIRAYTAYTDVTRLDSNPALQIIADAATSNVRIIEGTGSPANITLAAAATTISTLTQSFSGGTGAATIDSGTVTLLTNAVLVSTGAGALTIGNGTLTTATSGGDLALINNSANGLTINSVIANNTSASTLTKTGTGSLTLTAVNTYSGATSIGAGTLTLSGAGQLGSGTYAGAISSGTGSTLKYSSIADQTLSGVISGSGSLIKDTNASNLSLTAGNTYTGNTTVNSGTLTLAGATGVGTAGGYLYNAGASTATVTVASGAQIVISSNNAVHNALGNGTSQTWIVGGTINSTGGDAQVLPGTVTLNNGTLTGISNATFGTFLTNGGYTTTITANGNSNTISSGNFGMNSTSPLILATPLVTDALSVSSGLGVTGFLNGTLTKTGLGTVTLSGSSIYTGTTTVTGGTLKVTGSTNQGTGTDVLIANTATGNAVLNIQGPMAARYLSVGGVTGASGAVNISTGGSFTAGGVENELAFTFGAGATTGGYGYLGMTGGTVTTTRFQFGGNNVAAQNGVGVGVISGGTVNASGYILLARYGTSPGTIGTLTVATGGTLNHTSVTAGQNLALGWQGVGRAELNLTGGTITSASGRSVAFGGGTWTGTGILNLDAGTLTTTSFTTTGTSYLNFNGGTLKAVSTQAAFLPALTGVYVNGAFGSFTGGAIIDSNGVSITMVAPLIAPTGNGVTTIPVTSGGSGYIGAPAVTITDAGSGFGATAIANMVDDGTGNGTFTISSITITNPGNNYTAPAASFVGGGNGVTAATLGTLTTAANTSGGLTKNGTNYLTVSGNNTYTGLTTINAGSITLNSAIPNPNTSFVVNSGAQLYGGWAVPGMTFANSMTISGTGFAEGGINVGAVRASNNQTFTGTITLAANSRIGMIESGTTASTFSGQITGNFALNVQGAFTGSAATQTITLANTGTASDYSGDLSVSAVDYGGAKTGVATILKLGADNQIPNGALKGNLVFNGPDANHLTVFELNGKSETVNGLSNVAAVGAIIRNTATGASVLTIGDADTTSSFSGVISDGGVGKTLAITKTGTGTLTLTGLNTFLGTTTISGGQLTIDDGSIAISSNIVNDAALEYKLNANARTYANAISGSGTLTKTGTNTLTLTGANTYTGATTVSAGTLALVGGSQTSPISVAASASLQFTLNSGTTSTSTYNLTTGTIKIVGTPTLPSYTLTTSSGITGTPVLDTPITGYALTVDGTTLKLVQAAYASWAAANGLTGLPGSSTDPAKGADPDGDGKNNLYEFAFDGNPLSGANDGKVVGKIGTVGGSQVMTLTVPVRNTATFSANSGDQVSALIDGIYYKIEGDVDLGTFANTISEVGAGTELNAIQAGLPTLSSGWTYRTFRDAGTVPTVPKVFLRAKISDTP